METLDLYEKSETECKGEEEFLFFVIMDAFFF